MRSPGINGEGELRGKPANLDSPGKWPLKWSASVIAYMCLYYSNPMQSIVYINGINDMLHIFAFIVNID